MRGRVIVASGNSSRFLEFGGSTWVRLQYVLGLRKLGIDVYWVDRMDVVDPLETRRSVSYLTSQFRRRMEIFGLQDRYCIDYNHGEQFFGMTAAELDRTIDGTDLLLNLNGWLPDGSPLARVSRRVYIDVDPGFTQLWAVEHAADSGFDRHQFFFTVGQNVGAPSFTVPTHGIAWHTTVPPVVLEEWPSVVDQRCRSFSTVADWRGAQDAVFGGVHYGGKRSEFIRMLRLPHDSGQPIELALCIGMSESEDLGLLAGNGWIVLNAVQYAGDPESYREFIQTSRGEFSVAKNGYVRSRSGWISDRTACYLASGKPALVQSTGFEDSIPTGSGLLTFRDLPEAIAGIREINRNYVDHCRAARQLAESRFDSDRVLGRMLSIVGL